MRTERANLAPPWTTRWPTALMLDMSLMTPCSGLTRVLRMSSMATVWVGHSCLTT